MNTKEEISEIINQKKRFLFDVEATSTHVFPNEEFLYYVFIKNISGVEINNLILKVLNPDSIVFDEIYKENVAITLAPNDTKLYTLKSRCTDVGEFYVNFICYGDDSEIYYKTIKTNCNYNKNSDKLLHRIHIYDFTPYEDIYTREATNFSNQVTQTFKRQKLPYRPCRTPNSFSITKQTDDNNLRIENIESQSYIDQYNEARNTKEHVYQYISRDNFTEEAKESFVGENLFEIAKEINEKSSYFNANFLRTGNNELLNDFNQYEPNGFIYRMGLLSSEIYHNLGVLPEYEYMSDYLFRWAPNKKEPLNLYPKRKSMKWDENIWAGRGWNVSRLVTKEYAETDEFKKAYEEHKIDMESIMHTFTNKETAEDYVKKIEAFDERKRLQEKSDIIKYKYIIEESIYDTGVFIVNIPLSKIPANFYLKDTEEIYNIINRAKPYGAKPLLKYKVEKTFNQNMSFDLQRGYFQNFTFDMEHSLSFYDIRQKVFAFVKKLNCEGQRVELPSQIDKNIALYDEERTVFDTDMDIDIKTKPKFGLVHSKNNDNSILTDIEQNMSGLIFKEHNKLIKLSDIIETLYQKNYNNIAFSMANQSLVPHSVATKDPERPYNINNNDMIQVPIYPRALFNTGDIQIGFEMKESDNKSYKIVATRDTDNNLDKVQLSTINNQKEYNIQTITQSIKSISLFVTESNSKKMLIFFLGGEDGKLHYYTHIVCPTLKSIKRIALYVPKNKREKGSKLTDISKALQDLKTNKTLVSITDVKNGLYTDDVITFETPFHYNSLNLQPVTIENGENWKNLYRINNKYNTYSYIENLTKKDITPENIVLHYSDLNIPKTAIIKKINFKISTNSSNKTIYVEKAINTNYINPNAKNNIIQLIPNKIESSPNSKETPYYYKEKLNTAISNDNEALIEKYTKLLDNAIIFNEDMDEKFIENMKEGLLDDKNINKNPIDYLFYPNNYIIMDKPFWFELSEFTTKIYDLNNTTNIKLVIEGYNEGDEKTLIGQTMSKLDFSTQVQEKIPSGYFYKEIDLLYPNAFQTDKLRVRFRFKELNHPIKIFNTAINVYFKVKENRQIEWEFVDTANYNQTSTINLFEDYSNPNDINNGLSIRLSFDDLTQGEYYNINETNLEIIYQDTEIEFLANKNKYNFVSVGNRISSISGQNTGYLSGKFYNDYISIGQPFSNIGIDNHGVELRECLYQSFITRDNNITSIEVFPNGFYGNPDENLKIGIYENHGYSPGKLIKEVYANGWSKNNKELRDLVSIKYNFNLTGLKIDEIYWIKIEVVNPKQNSYYLLKSTNEMQKDFKLLLEENNNYTNTLNSLEFNIYSENLSKSFGDIPCYQDIFDNPYILIGLHKGQGNISNLKINKIYKTIEEKKEMSETFNANPEMELLCLHIFKEQANGEIVRKKIKDNCNVNIDIIEKTEEED